MMKIRKMHIIKWGGICFGMLMLAVMLVRIFPQKLQNSAIIISPIGAKPTPEISGWIAWWEEQKGYDLIKKYPDRITAVSPVWYMIDKNLNVVEVGTIDRLAVIKSLKLSHIKIIPTLGSELSGQELSKLFHNQNKRDAAITKLISRAKALDVNGIDIDLEGIAKEDKDAFTSFIALIADQFHANNLSLTVTVHAQTAQILWKGVEGQDLAKIGSIADSIRIMIYDEHSTDTDPGPIASFSWIRDVIRYNLTVIPKNKITVGIPSYGYIWLKQGDGKGMQYNEFMEYQKLSPAVSLTRDRTSGEMIYRGNTYTGWLSDSSAMIAKINQIRDLGINKIVIWHLGGMDERLFDTTW